MVDTITMIDYEEKLQPQSVEELDRWWTKWSKDAIENSKTLIERYAANQPQYQKKIVNRFLKAMRGGKYTKHVINLYRKTYANEFLEPDENIRGGLWLDLLETQFDTFRERVKEFVKFLREKRGTKTIIGQQRRQALSTKAVKKENGKYGKERRFIGKRLRKEISEKLLGYTLGDAERPRKRRYRTEGNMMLDRPETLPVGITIHVAERRTRFITPKEKKIKNIKNNRIKCTIKKVRGPRGREKFQCISRGGRVIRDSGRRQRA